MATDIIARALALKAMGKDDTGIFCGYVDPNSGFPTTRPDGAPISNEDYVRPKGEEVPFELVNPYTGDIIKFETKNSKAIFFNNDWILDPGTLQDTSETPVAKPELESYFKESKTQQAINIENVKLIKEIRDSLRPSMEITADKYLIKQGTFTSVLLTVAVRKSATDIKSIAILRNDIQITQRTEDVAPGMTFTYSDSINQTVKYKVKVIDIENRIFTSDPIEVTGCLPTYKGLISNPTALQELPLQKDANAEVDYSFAYDGAIYKYPKSYGELTSILAVSDNQAYENYLQSFTKTEDGDYYIYSMNDKCRLINYKFKFIKQ